jgi:5-methylcytosine-specific restriction protein A
VLFRSEGSVTQITQTRYERNIHARNECLKYFGYSCVVCDFNFEKYYGTIGYKFIHVHHLTQVATIGKEYSVNPIIDLRPVCPNCHAMLHKQNPPLTIEELKELLKDNI